MTESFFRQFTSKQFNVLSADTPSSSHNRIVIKIMKEINIDVTEQIPKLLFNFVIENSSKTVNMECVDEKSCPSFFVKEVLDYNMSDPKEKSIEVRLIRDKIKSEVLNLVKSLEASTI